MTTKDTRPGAAAAEGLLTSLRRFGATAIELVQVRLELIGTEIEEQKLRIMGGLVWAALGAMLIGLGLVLLVGFVVLLFWDSYRLHAVAVLTVVFLGGGALALRHAAARLKSAPGAFATSVAELAQDREALVPTAAPPARAP